MLFNSLPFLFFFPVVCIVVWNLRNLVARNIFLLLASYFFYMNWEPRYGLLLAFCSVIAYVGGLVIRQNPKKSLLVIFVFLLFGSLFCFKYLGFVGSVITDAMEMVGVKTTFSLPSFLLPVGISFYTFQAVGYLVDVYRKKVSAEKNFVDFALFLAFFPQLVAGPIERAENLLRQIKTLHPFAYENASVGLRKMLWGFFLKIVVADRLAVYCDFIFDHPDVHNGSSLLLASIFFAFQIYCDFAGYSLIAIGCAKMMGFHLMQNFNCPYFSCSISEFWRRWHISLSKWLKDYVYIPLGGNRCHPIRHKINVLLTFFVSGIWHGANWTFIVWGGLHGLFQVIEKMLGVDKPLSRPIQRTLQRLCTFVLALMAWVFFRSGSLSDAILILRKIFDFSNYDIPLFDSFSTMAFCFVAIAMLLFKDSVDTFFPKFKDWCLNSLYKRFCIYLILCCIILGFGVFDSGQFIYFQF